MYNDESDFIGPTVSVTASNDTDEMVKAIRRKATILKNITKGSIHSHSRLANTLADDILVFLDQHFL